MQSWGVNVRPDLQHGHQKVSTLRCPGTSAMGGGESDPISLTHHFLLAQFKADDPAAYPPTCGMVLGTDPPPGIDHPSH